MLADTIATIVKNFDDRQDALIEALGANFKKIITEQMLSSGVNFGKPPFIVDDGDVALLVIDKMVDTGDCHQHLSYQKKVQKMFFNFSV